MVAGGTDPPRSRWGASTRSSRSGFGHAGHPFMDVRFRWLRCSRSWLHLRWLFPRFLGGVVGLRLLCLFPRLLGGVSGLRLACLIPGLLGGGVGLRWLCVGRERSVIRRHLVFFDLVHDLIRLRLHWFLQSPSLGYPSGIIRPRLL